MNVTFIPHNLTSSQTYNCTVTATTELGSSATKNFSLSAYDANTTITFLAGTEVPNETMVFGAATCYRSDGTALTIYKEGKSPWNSFQGSGSSWIWAYLPEHYVIRSWGLERDWSMIPSASYDEEVALINANTTLGFRVVSQYSLVDVPIQGMRVNITSLPTQCHAPVTSFVNTKPMLLFGYPKYNLGVFFNILCDYPANVSIMVETFKTNTVAEFTTANIKTNDTITVKFVDAGCVVDDIQQYNDSSGLIEVAAQVKQGMTGYPVNASCNISAYKTGGTNFTTTALTQYRYKYGADGQIAPWLSFVNSGSTGVGYTAADEYFDKITVTCTQYSTGASTPEVPASDQRFCGTGTEEYNVTLTFPNSTALTNFPAKVVLDTSNSTVWNASSCLQVRFYDESDTYCASPLFFDYDTGCGTNNTIFWVGVNTTGASKTIYAVANKSLSNGEQASALWTTANYVAVLHGETSTGEETGLTTWACSGTCNVANAVFGKGVDLTVATSYITSTTAKFASGNNDWTVSVRVKPTHLDDTNEGIFSQGAWLDTLRGVDTFVRWSSTTKLAIVSPAHEQYTNTDLVASTSAFAYWGEAYDSGNVVVFKDTTKRSGTFSNLPLQLDQQPFIFSRAGGSDCPGYYDEMRYRNETSTDAWLQAEYSQSSSYSILYESYGGSPEVPGETTNYSACSRTKTFTGEQGKYFNVGRCPVLVHCRKEQIVRGEAQEYIIPFKLGEYETSSTDIMCYVIPLAEQLDNSEEVCGASMDLYSQLNVPDYDWFDWLSGWSGIDPGTSNASIYGQLISSRLLVNGTGCYSTKDTRWPVNVQESATGATYKYTSTFRQFSGEACAPIAVLENDNQIPNTMYLGEDMHIEGSSVVARTFFWVDDLMLLYSSAYDEYEIGDLMCRITNAENRSWVELGDDMVAEVFTNCSTCIEPTFRCYVGRNGSYARLRSDYAPLSTDTAEGVRWQYIITDFADDADYFENMTEGQDAWCEVVFRRNNGPDVIRTCEKLAYSPPDLTAQETEGRQLKGSLFGLFGGVGGGIFSWLVSSFISNPLAFVLVVFMIIVMAPFIVRFIGGGSR